MSTFPTNYKKERESEAHENYTKEINAMIARAKNSLPQDVVRNERNVSFFILFHNLLQESFLNSSLAPNYASGNFILSVSSKILLRNEKRLLFSNTAKFSKSNNWSRKFR